MPTLNWIGKEAVETHHKQVPFRLLEQVDALSCGDKDTGNLIVQGDNLLALNRNTLSDKKERLRLLARLASLFLGMCERAPTIHLKASFRGSVKRCTSCF